MTSGQSSVRVVYRWRVRSQCEEEFVRAWMQATQAIRDRVPGGRGSLLLRCQADPQLFIAIARWDSLEDWERFQAKPPPNPRAFARLDALSHLMSHEVFYEIEDERTSQLPSDEPQDEPKD
ncbi:antibiotic biosynthesis monooxygenase family protein [Baaleninema sp.]|uniref:antibiotic biosynthesis monooxygenase family protein n=1 Tax=Baaleninema sp. TaxID=3101197 RepID=UPI003CFC69CD